MAAGNSFRRASSLIGTQSVLIQPVKHPSRKIFHSSSYHILSNPLCKECKDPGHDCKLCSLFETCKNRIVSPEETCREVVKPTKIEMKIEEKHIPKQKSFLGSFLRGENKTETKIEDCKEVTFIPECEPQKIRIVRYVEPNNKPTMNRVFYDKCSEDCEEKFVLEAPCKPKKECKPAVPYVYPIVSPKLAPVKPICPPPCRPPPGFAEKFLHFLLPITGFFLGFYLRSSPPSPPPVTHEKKKQTFIEYIKPPSPVKKPDSCSGRIDRIDVYSRYCKDCNVDTVKLYRD